MRKQYYPVLGDGAYKRDSMFLSLKYIVVQKLDPGYMFLKS